MVARVRIDQLRKGDVFTHRDIGKKSLALDVREWRPGIFEVLLPGAGWYVFFGSETVEVQCRKETVEREGVTS